MILYVENLKDTTRKLLRVSIKSVKLQDTKLIQKSLTFLYTNGERTEGDIKDTIS